MSTLKNWLPVIFIVALLGIVVVAAASHFAFNNSVTVAKINVAGFLEAGCITPLSSLMWPIIAPGGNHTQSIYVNSTGTIPAVLNLTTSDWTPTYAEPYITYTWNVENVTIKPNEILEANITLTLALDMGNVTTSSFTAIINAEEP